MKSPTILLLLALVSCESRTYPLNLVEAPILPKDSTNLVGLNVDGMSGLAYQKDYFFFIDHSRNSIHQVNKFFEPIGTYSSIGRGPGELNKPHSLSTTSTFLFVSDPSQQKIFRLGLDMTPGIELVVPFNPLSIFAVNDSIVWAGTLNMEYEDIYEINFSTKQTVRLKSTAIITHPPEGIVFHSSNKFGAVLRYRQFSNRAEIFQNNKLATSFLNSTQPKTPNFTIKYDLPFFNSKTHSAAFLTESLACFLSGDIGPRRQPIQCFDFDGKLVSRYVIPTPSPFATYHDSLLYTYSPETNHIYVYDLGF